MRNPVGPLPSSIYWRRRAVALCVLALLALLAFWAVNSGGGGGTSTAAHGNSGHTPAASITPGPSATGPLISGRPGGPVESGSGDSGGASSGGSEATGGTTGDGSTDGSSTNGTTGVDAGSGSSGGSGADSTSTGGATRLSAGSSLPDCTSTRVTLTLRSAQNAYDPGEQPKFSLVATNTGGTACKLDFGATAAVLTITDVNDNHVWASDDCPSNRGAYLLQVPANGKTTYTAEWNGKTSSPQCATPKGQEAAPGTFLVKAKLPGFAVEQTSFVLSAS
jgi:hypothetical protein